MPPKPRNNNNNNDNSDNPDKSTTQKWVARPPKTPKAKDITNREYFSGEAADTSNHSLSSSPDIPPTPPQASPKTSSQGSVVDISKTETEKEKKGAKEDNVGKNVKGDSEDGEGVTDDEEEWVAAHRRRNEEEEGKTVATRKKIGQQNEGGGSEDQIGSRESM
ncbi:hypothetical protein DPSP01_010125 [Paraphaeosphaeria sporulosa]